MASIVFLQQALWRPADVSVLPELGSAKRPFMKKEFQSLSATTTTSGHRAI